MKLYHYASINNTIMTEGLLALNRVPKNLQKYAHRAGSNDEKDIIMWLEKTFEGRSRSISVLTEPIAWEGHDVVLEKIVKNSILYSVNLEELLADGLVTSIWCKNGSLAGGLNEQFYQVQKDEIDFSPLAWDKCDSSKDLLYAVIRHYLLVLTTGVIPPQYVTEEVF